MRELCGVGLSNSDCADAVGLACVGIKLCRDRFSDAEDHEVFDEIISLARYRHAWPVRAPEGQGEEIDSRDSFEGRIVGQQASKQYLERQI